MKTFSICEIFEKCFTQIYKALYGVAMLVSLWGAPTWRPETIRNICYQVLLWKDEFIPRGTHENYSNIFPNFRTVQIAKPPKISQLFNLHNISFGRFVNAVSRRRLEIQAFSFTKWRTLSFEVKICTFLASLTLYESKNSTQEDRQFFIFEFWWRHVKTALQNEAKCKTFPLTRLQLYGLWRDERNYSPDSIVKMSFVCVKIKKITFISIAAHFASLWNRGLRRLGNGLSLMQPLSGEHHGGTPQVT